MVRGASIRSSVRLMRIGRIFDRDHAEIGGAGSVAPNTSSIDTQAQAATPPPNDGTRHCR